ncbi:hypothetical protein CEXT_137921 [Caerostris extrusa]|uniref:Uncharacterized protein n=1 Tax=Caerostris extrusa TaxID=172846 RepID=A0AAV4QAN6_CAEEX|nr:hypothetical protein CEXT_137921 [Caerostris extrusa]
MDEEISSPNDGCQISAKSFTQTMDEEYHLQVIDGRLIQSLLLKQWMRNIISSDRRQISAAKSFVNEEISSPKDGRQMSAKSFFMNEGISSSKDRRQRSAKSF